MKRRFGLQKKAELDNLRRAQETNDNKQLRLPREERATKIECHL